DGSYFGFRTVGTGARIDDRHSIRARCSSFALSGIAAARFFVSPMSVLRSYSSRWPSSKNSISFQSPCRIAEHGVAFHGPLLPESGSRYAGKCQNRDRGDRGPVPVSKGTRLSPSSLYPSGCRAPAISRIVGYRSTPVTGVSETLPGLILPGHVTAIGT